MRQYKFILLITSLLFSIETLHAQEVGVELAGNPQTESFGIGARIQFPVSYFTLSPQLAYYPAFNKVSELYLGTSLHLNVISINSARVYALGNASYNSWLNYADSPMPNAKKTNWGIEFGGGIQGNSCFSPFFEYRYNIKWKETNARLGILIDLGCMGKNGPQNLQYKERKAVNCPGH